MPKSSQLSPPRLIHLLQELSLPCEIFDDSNLTDDFGSEGESIIGSCEQFFLILVVKFGDDCLSGKEENEDCDSGDRAPAEKSEQEVDYGNDQGEF